MRMRIALRLGGVALSVMAFFFALGAVVALGSGALLLGVMMFPLAALLAIGGWTLRGYGAHDSD